MKSIVALNIIALMTGAIVLSTITQGEAEPQLRPPFDGDVHPPAPDYAQSSAWAALPGTPSAAAETPAKMPPLAANSEALAGVFYVHPTTFRSQARFIAAYTPGVDVSLGEFGKTYKSVSACDKPIQLGCIASWSSFETTGDPSMYRKRSESKFSDRCGFEGRTILCVNPLTFDTSRPSAPASANLGSLPGAPSHDPLPPLVAGEIGATCVDGILMVSPPTSPEFKVRLLPNGFLHYYDIDFYYKNIELNALLRVNYYFERRAAMH